ncbi:guanylate cyclase domain-containing protein, partial [Haematococcus lacustris]
MTVEHALLLAQVIGIPIVQSPLIMYVNWPLLTSMYNISRLSLKEFGRLSFYPDTWQELAAVMHQVNATASDPITGKPRHALCMPSETGSTFLFTAVLTSIMQTGGTSQGWLYDPLTLEPLTNNTAMLKALEMMWELSPFLRGFDASSTIDMSQCAIALAPSSLFKSLHPLYSNAQFMGQLTMSPLPASTDVLDRKTMQLVPCTAQLCNSQRATKLGGQLVNLAPTSHRGAASFLGMTTLVPPKLRTAVYNLIAYICSPGVSKSPLNPFAPFRPSGLLAYAFPEPETTPGISSWSRQGYNYTDVVSYSTALEQVVAMPFVADDFKVADSLGSLYYGQNALLTLVGCKMPLVPRSAGSPADFAAAMNSMTAGLRAVRDSLGAAALREQLWGTTGFVPPTQPPPPTPPSPSPPLA